NYLDWQNDYFVITNKHLVHREFDLRRFRTNLVKIPIDQIQSVEIDKPSFISNLFNFGTARVTTAAQGAAGVIRFDNIDDPSLVRDTLNRLSQRVKAMDAGREQAMMRESLEKHFAVQQPLQTVAEESAGGAQPAPPPLSFWESLRRAYRWRVEIGGVITYRKHFFVLLGAIAWPVFAFVLILLVYFLLTRVLAFSGPILGGLLALAILVDLGWFVWRFEDWRNDTFQVTDRLVIDIDRRPFGFGESRKQASLSNIQNVTADRPGLLQTIFNFGNVHVETAGAKSDITFENVASPSRIQSDIFQKLDQVRQAERVKEGAMRRKEYAVLLDVYTQATEQNRIPRRTPPPGDLGLEN
ncbi:MAG: PH domain-containing protein, partial [Anaerolineales bacterium]|nr:PH domain-containing protein [Anaerolineales bacterium]